MGEHKAIETIRSAIREAPRRRTMLVLTLGLLLLIGLTGITMDGITAFIDGITGRRDITFGWAFASLFAIYPAAALCLFRNDWADAIRWLLLARRQSRV